MSKLLAIEVVYAARDSQKLVTVAVPENTPLRTAIEASGMLVDYPEIDLSVNKVGIHGHIKPLDTILRDLDRIEIYRPLIADPKDARHRRVALGKMTKKARQR